GHSGAQHRERPMRRAHFAAATVCVLAARAGAQAPATDDVVMRAMRDELARSIRELRLDTLPRPYFIAYRVSEGRSFGAGGRLGAVVANGEGAGNRAVQVEVHVG